MNANWFTETSKSEKVRTALIAAVLLLVVGVTALASGGNFLGQTLGTAFLPERGQTERTMETSSAEAVVGTSSSESETELTEISNEALWLARVIYSETKRPEEQELVAWVVRNRVETGYRGNDTYREAVLDPYQFSAFNPGSRKRTHYLGLDSSSKENGWQRALRIAQKVKEAPVKERPFSEGTRHFFSERSMAGGRHPNWAARGTKVKPEGGEINERRFRFYENVR